MGRCYCCIFLLISPFIILRYEGARIKVEPQDVQYEITQILTILCEADSNVTVNIIFIYDVTNGTRLLASANGTLETGMVSPTSGLKDTANTTGRVSKTTNAFLSLVIYGNIPCFNKTYRCVITTNEGESQAEISINVTADPGVIAMTASPEKKEYEPGDTVRLTCTKEMGIPAAQGFWIFHYRSNVDTQSPWVPLPELSFRRHLAVQSENLCRVIESADLTVELQKENDRISYRCLFTSDYIDSSVILRFKKSMTVTYILIGVAGGMTVLLLVGCAYFYYKRVRRSMQEATRSPGRNTRQISAQQRRSSAKSAKQEERQKPRQSLLPLEGSSKRKSEQNGERRFTVNSAKSNPSRKLSGK